MGFLHSIIKTKQVEEMDIYDKTISALLTILVIVASAPALVVAGIVILVLAILRVFG